MTNLSVKRGLASLALAMVSALAVSGTPALASSDYYAAIAAGPRGSAYAEGYETMEDARDAAVSKCRSVWRTSCSVSTAEDEAWYYSAGLCDGEPYTAASPESAEGARSFLFAKAHADGRKTCQIFANH
jgi:hypothetical protein